MPRANVELKLYDANDEVVKDLHRLIVPWGVLKKANRLGKRLKKSKEEELEDADIDEISSLVVEIFGEDRVTVEELDKYADVGDLISVILSIANRAKGIIPNAPPVA
jgi:hypothetical protein